MVQRLEPSRCAWCFCIIDTNGSRGTGKPKQNCSYDHARLTCLYNQEVNFSRQQIFIKDAYGNIKLWLKLRKYLIRLAKKGTPIMHLYEEETDLPLITI